MRNEARRKWYLSDVGLDPAGNDPPLAKGLNVILWDRLIIDFYPARDATVLDHDRWKRGRDITGEKRAELDLF